MEIALLGERFDAAAAERLGLVNRIIPSALLDAELEKMANRFAQGPTRVYARTKALLNGSLGATLDEQLGREAQAFAQSASEPDFAEGVAAFIEKRKPRFTGA
jgi:2-(1,2-epoxy-1,2-dihydrophenyl)acetyl-CoA isomerase